MYHNRAHGDEHRGRGGMRKGRLIAVAASAATVSLLSTCATGLSAAAPASASISKPPACAPLSPTSTTPPTLKPTTITTIEQAYYCILANYYSGPVLDDRTLLVPAFAALTQQLQRRGLDRADATMPALTGNRDHDIAAFAAVYQRILAELPASTRLVQALAEATMHGMVNSLTDDHVLWLRHAIGVYPLGVIISSTRGSLVADPAATPPVYVTSVFTGSPAAAAGIRAGDEFVSVNGIPPYINRVLDQNVIDLLTMSHGPLRLVLHRPATGRTFTVKLTTPSAVPPPATRTASPTPTSTTPPPQPSPVTSRLLDGNVAYVKMDEFSLAAAADVLAAIVKLGKGRTLHGVVLDLRANGGGDPAADSKLLGAWVHGKAWTYFCNVRGHCTAQYTDDSVPLLHLPLVVLTSRFCASACDAFAATVKDLHLGTLVGTRTAGIVSGPGQAYVLDDGTVLGLPSLHGLMADKEIADSIGVAPDYEAPLTADALSAGRDPGLAKALNLLR